MDPEQEQLKLQMEMEAEAEAAGEPGHAGVDLYAKGPHALQPTKPPKRMGDLTDAAKSWANKAALGGGPQIAGAMGALAELATKPNPGDDPHPLDAYRDVRDATAKDLESSENTALGETGGLIGMMSTPGLPKPLAAGTLPQKVRQAANVGGGIGLANAAFTSPVDLTRPTGEGLNRFARDVGVGGAGGYVGGGAMGPLLAAGESPARALAEQQALRAAGLRGGIKNSLRKDLGVSNMEEARQLGRQFLDEGLIPPVGGAESVARRAESLQGQSGNVVGSHLTEADVAARGMPDFPVNGFSFSEGAEATRAPLLDPNRTSAVERAAGGKAFDLADQVQQQGAITPGSFVGANKVKSDAWRGANFSADPDLSATAYRKGVSGLRQNIEDQVSRVLGPEKAASLKEANRRYGVGADALKLAENASTRDAAKKGFGWPEILAALGGGEMAAQSGHGAGGGLAGGLAAVLGAKAFDKWGHSTAAHAADLAGDVAASGAGAGLGGQVGSSLARSERAPWSSFLKTDEEQR